MDTFAVLALASTLILSACAKVSVYSATQTAPASATSGNELTAEGKEIDQSIADLRGVTVTGSNQLSVCNGVFNCAYQTVVPH